MEHSAIAVECPLEGEILTEQEERAIYIRRLEAEQRRFRKEQHQIDVERAKEQAKQQAILNQLRSAWVIQSWWPLYCK